jgi:hypothetical protein
MDAIGMRPLAAWSAVATAEPPPVVPAPEAKPAPRPSAGATLRREGRAGRSSTRDVRRACATHAGSRTWRRCWRIPTRSSTRDLEGGDEDGEQGGVLDAAERERWARQLADWRDGLEEARSFNDPGRAERAAERIEALSAEIAKRVQGGAAQRSGAAAAGQRHAGDRARRRADRRGASGPRATPHRDAAHRYVLPVCAGSAAAAALGALSRNDCAGRFGVRCAGPWRSTGSRTSC